MPTPARKYNLYCIYERVVRASPVEGPSGKFRIAGSGSAGQVSGVSVNGGLDAARAAREKYEVKVISVGCL
jgi:hypothetical protein